MRRNISRSSHHEEKSEKSSRGEEYGASRPKTEEEKMQRRREWIIQQERVREHERLKRKKILEYELRRAREKGLPPPKLPCHSPSRSKSKSPQSRHRRSSTCSSTKTPVLSERLESSDGTTPLFKGPEGTQISATELRRIKVDIHRNIPGKSNTMDLERDIVNPEDVVVKRRAGEGAKPIFEREEIKGSVTRTEEIEEHRTVVTVDNENLEGNSKRSKKRLTSLSPVRTQNHSPRCTSSRHTRHEDSRRDDRESFRSDRERHRSRDKSREYKDSCREEDRRHVHSHSLEDERNRKGRRDHSRSRERDQRKWNRDSRYKDERSCREYRKRSRERSEERRNRDRSREQRVPPPHYIEQIPVPIYYGNFPPRPILMGPLIPIRGQMPLRGGRHPSMMAPIRPFPPRFISSDVYRLRPPSNPRFGPMF